jgi:hypothetical protein
MDGDVLSFAYFWLKKSEDDWWERLAKLLGVLWTSEDLAALRGNHGGRSKSRSVLMPLLIGLRPELREHLEKVLEGDSTTIKADVNLADLPKEEFLKWASQVVKL